MGFLKEFIHKEMQVAHPKIKRILDAEDEWMEYLMKLTDKRLERKMNNINLQLPMALEQKKFVELDALYLYKILVMQARIRKNEIECETGIYEEDEEKKAVRKRKAKPAKQKEKALRIEQQNEINEESDDDKAEKPQAEQLSLFNFDGET